MPTKADFIEQGRKCFENKGPRPFSKTLTPHWSVAAMQQGWDAAKKGIPREEPQPVSTEWGTSTTGRGVITQPNLQNIPSGSPVAQCVRQAFSNASQKSKLMTTPARAPLGIGSKNLAFFPRPVVCHLDALSYRHQFAASSTDADRYKRSSDRVIARWTKRINAAKVRNGLTA